MAHGIEVLEIADARDCLHPVVLGGKTGYALVDTGFPGMMGPLEAALRASGCALADIGQIVLTHQDLDHIGGVNGIRELAPRVQIWAHVDDAPFMSGLQKPLKLASDEADYEAASPGRKRFIDEARSGYAASVFEVDHLLNAGDELVWDVVGPVRVLHAPGHTPGHIMLYAEHSRTLIPGDGLVVADGRLIGPLPQFAEDLTRAYASLEQLLSLPIRTVVAYHGGVFQGDIHGALRGVIEAFQGTAAL
ncbi:MAG: MBL fold metallo-hydrolase [Coriobacteriales bacterium]|nr:MBL fold metallo-hydrolase [Coriobacteriales bacterium]